MTLRFDGMHQKKIVLRNDALDIDRGPGKAVVGVGDCGVHPVCAFAASAIARGGEIARREQLDHAHHAVGHVRIGLT